MAEIKFKATVKSAYDRFLIVYEKHSKKNAQDVWETTGYTDFKVWLPEGMSGSEFAEKDFIEVQGKQKTEVTEKDGKTYKNLVVNAQVVETIKGNKPAVPNTWAEVDAPF
jgi:hypothetical protein